MIKNGIEKSIPEMRNGKSIILNDSFSYPLIISIKICIELIIK